MVLGGIAGIWVGVEYLTEPLWRMNPQRLGDDEVALGLVFILLGVFWWLVVVLIFVARYQRLKREWRQFNQKLGR
jgi:hypothetical protein